MEVYYQNGHLYCFCENGENVGGRWGLSGVHLGPWGEPVDLPFPAPNKLCSHTLNYLALDGTTPAEASIVDSWIHPQMCENPSSFWSPETKTSFLYYKASTKLNGGHPLLPGIF